MTGYGLAFPRNSKYLKMFNKRLLDFRENGDLERLRRYWMTGVCRPGKQVVMVYRRNKLFNQTPSSVFLWQLWTFFIAHYFLVLK